MDSVDIQPVRLSGVKPQFPGVFEYDNILRCHIGTFTLKNRKHKVLRITVSQKSISAVTSRGIVLPTTEQILLARG